MMKVRLCISMCSGATKRGIHVIVLRPFLTVAVVGLERTSYQVSEGVNMLELCVIVYSPSIECPIEIPFNVNLFTSDNTAGNYNMHTTLPDIVCNNAYVIPCRNTNTKGLTLIVNTIFLSWVYTMCKDALLLRVSINLSHTINSVHA